MLEENVVSIRGLNCRLPLSLNGPAGSVTAKTVKSLKLLKWGLERMKQNLDSLGNDDTSLLSCMTLDVENLHSVIHHKNQVSITICARIWNHSKTGAKTHNIVVGLLLHKPWAMVPSSGKIIGPSAIQDEISMIHARVVKSTWVFCATEKCMPGNHNGKGWHAPRLPINFVPILPPRAVR